MKSLCEYFSDLVPARATHEHVQLLHLHSRQGERGTREKKRVRGSDRGGVRGCHACGLGDFEMDARDLRACVRVCMHACVRACVPEPRDKERPALPGV